MTLCKCGHEQINHTPVERTDTERGYWGKCGTCSCKRFERADETYRFDKIIKAEKEESGLYKVTLLNEKNKKYILRMSEIGYKMHQHKLLLVAQGCNVKTLESFEELVRKDTEEIYEQIREL